MRRDKKCYSKKNYFLWSSTYFVDPFDYNINDYTKCQLKVHLGPKALLGSHTIYLGIS